MTTEARKFAEAVVAEAERQGWRVHSGRHWKLYAPDGRTIVVIASTPRTVGGVEQSIRRMERAGFSWQR
jgi:hypothetical protein